jgi:8-oxo-dGTP pyrophosphatase MutT (NUDIX family)
MYYSPLLRPPSSQVRDQEKATASNLASPLDLPVKLHSRQLVFENTVFRVFADKIGDANGHEVSRYLSVVPKCLLEGSIAGVAVLPTQEGNVGLIRVFRHPLGRWSWEAIKGHAEPGEDPTTAALRELQEESGFSATAEHLIDLGTVAPEAGVIEARTRLFAVALGTKARGHVDGELGHGEMAFFGRDEVYDLIAQGEIEDASTLAILFKHLLNQQSRPDFE